MTKQSLFLLAAQICILIPLTRAEVYDLERLVTEGEFSNTFKLRLNIPEPQTAALLTPGMLFTGEFDLDNRRLANQALFDINRPRGALWAWTEEEDKGHTIGDSEYLILPFLAECVRLRYPANQSPVNGPVTLKNLHESDGWLVDQSDWEGGSVKVYPYDEAPGDKRQYGWVPSEKIARYYQAFASYNKASLPNSWTNFGVVESPAELTHAFSIKNSRADPFVAAETTFYYDGELVGVSDPPDSTTPQITVDESSGGFHVFTAVVLDTNGKQRATHLNRVFVKGPRPLSAFESWAVDNLPEGFRGPQVHLFDDGVTNLERFAHGLGLEKLPKGFQVIQFAESGFEKIDDTDYVVFSYPVGEEARTSGLNIMPQVSTDGQDWSDFVNIDDPAFGLPHVVTREGTVVTAKYPLAENPLFFRIALTDTFEGLD
ncbi:hypothetical protein G0Q06_10540 [Puniceicoccales bacterium CK1056]|uniref:Uncharacterized protein n=1 Tax=Oceanipulchritudo coccoides TaxID=2706888 RepID=A0A6B2M3U9_9BACT|nr:hypothetical protein [Oceanipulchritudo coccoides]NDV62889.1 hypothetical protein [Oceanipulchritudo coccoides]